MAVAAVKPRLERRASFMPGGFSSYVVKVAEETVGYLRQYEKKRRNRPMSVNVTFWTATLADAPYPLGADLVRVKGRWTRAQVTRFETRAEALAALLKKSM